MVAPLDGNSLISTLVNGSGARGSIEGVPTLSMGYGKPSHEFTELCWIFGPEYKVPVIWHNAICQQADGHLVFHFEESPFKSGVIRVLPEQGYPLRGSVEDVIDNVRLYYARSSRH